MPWADPSKRSESARQYRERNRERIAAYKREWRERLKLEGKREADHRQNDSRQSRPTVCDALPRWMGGRLPERELPARVHRMVVADDVEGGKVLEIPPRKGAIGRPEKRGFTQRRETMLWDAYVLHTEGWELTGVFWG